MIIQKVNNCKATQWFTQQDLHSELLKALEDVNNVNRNQPAASKG